MSGLGIKQFWERYIATFTVNKGVAISTGEGLRVLVFRNFTFANRTAGFKITMLVYGSIIFSEVQIIFDSVSKFFGIEIHKGKGNTARAVPDFGVQAGTFGFIFG